MPINRTNPKITIIRYKLAQLTPGQQWRVIGFIYWIQLRDRLRGWLAG